MQKHLNLVDLVKSFPTNIYLQNLASIQKRTSPVKFAHLAEKSGEGSISNLSTKARTGLAGALQEARELVWGAAGRVADALLVLVAVLRPGVTEGRVAPLPLFEGLHGREQHGGVVGLERGRDGAYVIVESGLCWVLQKMHFSKMHFSKMHF